MKIVIVFTVKTSKKVIINKMSKLMNYEFNTKNQKFKPGDYFKFDLHKIIKDFSYVLRYYKDEKDLIKKLSDLRLKVDGIPNYSNHFLVNISHDDAYKYALPYREWYFDQLIKINTDKNILCKNKKS